MSPDVITPAGAAKIAKVGARGLGSVLRAGAYTKRNDRLALRAFEDLMEWARRERREQAERLGEIDADIDDDWYYGPIHLRRQREAREPSAERWREQKRLTDRIVEDVHDSENFVHAVVRRLRKRPWPPHNPYAAETNRLAENWDDPDRPLTPREIDPPPPEFERLTAHAPGLMRLYDEASGVRDPGDTPSFCANRVWYHRFKPRVVKLVGYEAAAKELRTTQAYGIGYQTIYDALPYCRDCGEASMEDFFDSF